MHEQNEDAYGLEQLSTYPDCWFGAIADGQGGQFGAARAAQATVQTLLEQARTVSYEDWEHPWLWTKLFRECDRAVYSDPSAGYTTLVAFTITGGHLFGASCGDSIILCKVRGTEIVEVTNKQRNNPPIGSGHTSSVYFTEPLTPPWSVLAMTDGVWKSVGLGEVQKLMQKATGEELSTKLQFSGLSRSTEGYGDDFTFLLLEA
jgi:hypothetical protein